MKIKKIIEKFEFSNLISRHLNSKNLNSIKNKDIEKLYFLYEKEKLQKYIRNLIYKWEKENKEFDSSHVNHFVKLFKKFHLPLDDNDEKFIYTLNSRFLTHNRNLKTLEAPIVVDNILKEKIIFSFRNVSIFKTQNGIIKKIDTGYFLLNKNNLVLYNLEKNEIIKIIEKINVDEINKQKRDIMIKLTDNSTYYLSYVDPEILFIAFYRLWNKNTNIFNKLSEITREISLKKILKK